MDVTVIVPFHNELSAIAQTLARLRSQSLQPREVIFVDSHSSDGTHMAILELLNALPESTTTFSVVVASEQGPGGARNQGLVAARGKYVAFMDCGLYFATNWLERFLTVLESQPQSTWISGVCRLEGVGLVDQCSVANTYGYRRARPALPSSIIRTDQISKIGPFRLVRAGEDIEWISRCSALGMTRFVDPTTEVKYEEVNYSSSLASLFQKSFEYSKHMFQAGRFRSGIVVLLSPLVAVLALCLDALSIGHLFLAYLVLRISILAAKNQGRALRYLNPNRLLMVLLTFSIIDLSRFLGVMRSALYLVTARRET